MTNELSERLERVLRTHDLKLSSALCGGCYGGIRCKLGGLGGYDGEAEGDTIEEALAAAATEVERAVNDGPSDKE